MKGWWEESQQQTEHPVPAIGSCLREENNWLNVNADQEYVLQVTLRRINVGQQRVSSPDSFHLFLKSLDSGIQKADAKKIHIYMHTHQIVGVIMACKVALHTQK